MENPEQIKYIDVYHSTPDYGKTNHGQHAFDIVSDADSILDIGCGHNNFCRRMAKSGVPCIGIDFACKKADMVLDVTQELPFEDKSYDYVTAFDVLEHLLPEQVDPSLQEMSRISRQFCFSVSTVPSRDIKGLHPTVRPFEWWIETIMKYAKTCEPIGQAYKNLHPHLVGEWK